ncbi:MAG: DNA polymerase III subunit gamma/tau, partial [Treponema sp.]|nr:DNA polymerase III subunit gamma/tau [Treponema sp.]
MAYEVTATKRRPKTFDELAGQEFVAATLKNSLETGHIAQAYLFSGPRGCGKTSAARILARSLRCEKGPAASPCGVCPQCGEIAGGSSMDVIEIDGASNTSVNDVRQIKEEILFPPITGRYKVYIIDEVHMLSSAAFNALLKTIEEPPPNVVFIFATTELQKVPATIKSRCQQFNFRLIPIETITEQLRAACGEMNIDAEDEALFWIAREATGSLRDAYTLFDQVASFSGGHIRTALIREKFGLVGLEKLNELAEACAANNYPGAWAIVDGVIASGVAIEQFVIDLAGYYHSLFLLKAGILRESILGYSPGRFSSPVLEKLDSVRLAQAQDLLFALHRDIRVSLSPRFELETLVSKLCWLDQWLSPPELGRAVQGARDILEGGIARPLAGGGSRPLRDQDAAGRGDLGTGTEIPPAPRPAASLPEEKDPPLPDSEEENLLTKGFKRMIAFKGNSEKAGNFPPPAPGDAFFSEKTEKAGPPVMKNPEIPGE